MDQKTCILKAWKKFRKPRINLQKTFGNPVFISGQWTWYGRFFTGQYDWSKKNFKLLFRVKFKLVNFSD